MFPQNMNMANYMMTGNLQGGNNNPDYYFNMIYGQGMQNLAQMNPIQFNPFQKITKVNVVFKTTGGLSIQMFIDIGTPISQVILTYLKRVGKPELYSPNIPVFFFCNAARINIYDDNPIESLSMGGGSTLNIMVNDVQNLIGA